MKTVSTVLLFFLTCSLFGQEYSLAIPLTPDKRSDAGIQIEKSQDGYLILGGVFCRDSLPYDGCVGLLKTNNDGYPVWSATFDGSPFGSLTPNSRSMVIHNDTIYVANMIWKADHNEIRMMSFDMDGGLIRESDFFIPYDNTFFLRGMIGTDEKLVVFSEVKQGGQHRVLIQDFDFQLSLSGEYHLGISPYKKRDVILKQTEGGNGFLLAYGEETVIGQSEMNFNRLDAGYNITYSKKMPDKGDPFSATDFIETEGGRYMLAWNIDYTQVLFDTFPYPTIVYGLDSLFNVEWEHIFVHKAAKHHISTIKTREGNMLGIGGTDFLEIHDIYPTREWDGWCFLLSHSGELEWDRVIADIRNSGTCLLWHGLETDDAFVMTGYIDKDNPSGVPFLNDPEVWLLTLDKNGCWNGNCEEVIIITGDNTSITDAHEVPETKLGMKVYPNPTMGLLTIESDNGTAAKERSVRVSGMNGKLITTFSLHAPKSTINLRELENGTYIITLLEDGMPVSSKKIIVHH